ncbi:TIGR03032 family protein [Limnobacter sp.]|uniref:TIGR03032 family protein n=1 Tax=Limnobacter sp. TaxID=2003368 RepID=UPI00258DD47A|nr:TIGR03032 family protein [Limnobacter sp.]
MSQTQSNQLAHTQVVCTRAWENLQRDLGFSLVMGTRATGDLHLVSVKKDVGVHLHIQKFPLCMGIATWRNQLWVACVNDVRQYTDILQHPGVNSIEFERCYVPRSLHFTGPLDAHEIAVDRHGQLLIVSSQYSAVVRLSNTHSAGVIWQPAFISALKPEDRCHLNGLCLQDGELKYVTLFARSDAPSGWRKLSFEQGEILDVSTGDAVCEGLVQPHSPRLYRGQLYVLNSGAGEFGLVDLKTGRFECIAYVAGYGRGLSFVGDYAIFGVSRPKTDVYISGLKLHDRLRAMQTQDRCALIAVHLATGDVIEGIQFHGAVRELFDTHVIEDCRSVSMMDMDQAQNPGLVVIDPVRNRETSDA